MARTQFGGNDLEIRTGTFAQMEPGATIFVWLNSAATTPALDLQDAGHVAVTTGHIAATADSKIPTFYGPDGVTRLWLTVNGGTPQQLDPPVDPTSLASTYAVIGHSHTDGAGNPKIWTTDGPAVPAWAPGDLWFPAQGSYP